MINKKSTITHKIQTAKGVHIGYIRVHNGTCSVLWLNAGWKKNDVISMSFVGPAAILFGTMVVEFDGTRVAAPVTIAPTMKEVKKELEIYTESIKNIRQIFMDVKLDPDSPLDEFTDSVRFTVEQYYTSKLAVAGMEICHEIFKRNNLLFCKFESSWL